MKTPKLKLLEEFRFNPEPEPDKPAPTTVIRFKANYKREEAIASETFRHKNRLIWQYYYQTRDEIKELIQKLPDESDRLVYEWCRKKEKDSLHNVYDFLSPQVRFHLVCWYDLKYYIHYTIGESQLKETITKKIQHGISCNFNLIEVPLKPDFKTFYNNAMEFRKDRTWILPFKSTY